MSRASLKRAQYHAIFVDLRIMISSKILSNFRSLSLSTAVMAKSGHELNFVRHLQMQTLVQLSTNKPLLAATQCQVSQVRTKIRDLRLEEFSAKEL